MVGLSVNDVVVGLRERWRRMRRARRSLVELSACPPAEQQRIAQDAGVSVSDLRVIAGAHAGPAELLPRRLRLVGLDPAYLRFELTATYRDLERTCAMCPAWRRCARDLAKRDVQAGMGSYCLCATTIDALSVGRDDLPAPMTAEPWLPSRRPSPWPMYHRVERRAVRIHEMMRRLEVDPAALARVRRGDAYAEARARCLGCRASQACLNWLDAPGHGGERPQLCPNLALFETCRRRRLPS